MQRVELDDSDEIYKRGMYILGTDHGRDERIHPLLALRYLP